jgi:hypothetical protein
LLILEHEGGIVEETELRELAAALLAELPDEIPDEEERIPVVDGINAALAAPIGSGGLNLLAVLSDHEVTRHWIVEHVGSAPDTLRVGLPGDPTTPQGVYYICPNNDYDVVVLTAPELPPLCPNDGLELTTGT